MKYYIGIDPGLHGAVAILWGDKLETYDTPTTIIKSGKKKKSVYVVSQMVNIFKCLIDEDVHVGIESQHAMPKQGVSSVFNLGYGYGLWIGILTTMGLPHTTITPQAWKKEMMRGMGKEKAASCIRAQQLYPDAELFTVRGRALDGRGDALLIATYLKSTINN